MLQYELPDIEQPGRVLQSSVILDGFNHLGEKVTFKQSVFFFFHCLSVIVSIEARSVFFLNAGRRAKRNTAGFLLSKSQWRSCFIVRCLIVLGSPGNNSGKPDIVHYKYRS